MKSKIYSSDYVKTTSKGQVWIPAFLAIGFLMAFPVAELMTLGNWFGMNYESAQIEQLYERMWRDRFLFSGLVVCAVGALINGINNFWYLYSSKKVDFYHSLPVKRPQMFWHRTYVGILYYLVPYLVMEFLSICIGAMRGFFSLKLMKLALVMLVLHLIMYLFLYFSVVLVVCMTGNILMGTLCLAAVFSYGPVLGELISMYQRTFFSTFFGTDYGVVKILKKEGSPFFLCSSFLRRYADGDYGMLLAVILILMVLTGTAAYFAYVKRPSESTGKSMIYRWSETVIRLMVVIPSGLGAGLIFYMLPNRQGRIVWGIFGMLAGTVLVHGIIEVVYRMDFRKFLSHKLQLVLAAVVVGVCAFVFQQDLTGYDTYLPAYDKLKGIGISTNYYPAENNNTYVERYDDGTYRISENTWSGGVPDIDGINVGLSRDIYSMLGTVIAHNEERKPGYDNAHLSHDYYENTYVIPVKYVLKSGEVVYREYRIGPEDMRGLLKACYDEGTFKEHKYSFLNVEEKYLQWVRGTFCDGESYVLFQDDKDKMTALIEALAADVAEADADMLLGNPCASLYVQYENIPLKLNGDRIDLTMPGMQNTGFVYANVEVYPEFKRTLALLKETGYPVSMDDVELEYVKIDYLVTDQDGNYVQGESEKYDSSEELKDFKECINFWNFENSDINVLIKTKNGREEISVGLIKDKIPSYVKENMERAKNGEMESTFSDKDNTAAAEDNYDGDR